jgi:hypothetical protein
MVHQNKCLYFKQNKQYPYMGHNKVVGFSHNRCPNRGAMDIVLINFNLVVT